MPAYCTRYGAVTVESAHQYPLVDWGFITQPEEGLGGRRLHYGRGKTLGGRHVCPHGNLGEAVADLGMHHLALRKTP